MSHCPPEAAAPPVKIADERGGYLGHGSVQWQIVSWALYCGDGVEGAGAT